ncbi:protein of unknown function [Noviherbaspirillum humi]|uniref:DUF4390 domain-containing protein n=1 Tax=Noviherbaspirillum humi TaxID=1688639 RepID=A0A239C9H6_9BURK|nr:DUF4390 domain-containing protein [Noviherbaspirillum humi]SNS16750.1 protein of unknown function [Noviherbaspirillum humi]
MTLQKLHSLICWLFASALLALSLAAPPARADGIEITRALMESTDEGYKLSLGFSFDLNRGLEDAVNRGIPLYFTTDVEVTRPRWYWFDEKTLSATQTVRISYNVLTHQYHAAIGGRLQQSFSTLDDALSLVRRPGRWLIAEKGTFKPGDVYNVAVRMGLDVTRLPKPFQVNAINNSDWRFSSDWKLFLFRAE